MKPIIAIITILLGLSLNAQIYINNAPKNSPSRPVDTNGGIIVNENSTSIKKETAEINTSVNETKIEVIEKVNTSIEETKITVKEPISKPNEVVEGEISTIKVTEVDKTNSLKEVESTLKTTKVQVTPITTTPTTIGNSKQTIEYNTSSTNKITRSNNEPLTFIRKKIDAQYETVYETIQIASGSPKTIQVKPEFRGIDEQIMVTPATKKWVKTGVKEDCKSPNPKDCEVLTLIEVPPTYKTVKNSVTLKETYNKEIVQPKTFKVVKKQVLVSPERYEDVLITSKSAYRNTTK